jgi:hypothetical protein
VAENVSEPKTLAGVALLVAAVAAAVAGCGRVERLPAPYAGRTVVRPGASPSPSEEVPAEPDDPSAVTPEPTDAFPTITAMPDATASPCSGGPGASQVIAALRRERNLLPSGATPKIVTGPLCAGSWQYTVMNVSGHDTLQVVTRSSAGALTVVTAGTYVCIPEVLGAAPDGIVSAAHCG